MRSIGVLIAAFGAAVALVPVAHATTWGESKVRDPVSGNDIEVQEPMSSAVTSIPGLERKT